MTRELAGAPEHVVDVPRAVAAFAGDAAVVPVWRNLAGGLTFRVGRRPDDDAPSFVKWNPRGSGESLAEEERRLDWLEGRFRAPRVVASGRDEHGEWLATAAIEAESAVSPYWSERADAAARAVAFGLRELHDALDPDDCPFDWGVDARVRVADRAGARVPADLREAPPIDRLVVCHGDPCAPNTLIDRDGRFAGIVDVGRLGVGDRWADLAVASWSLEWNYGDGHEAAFFDAYGVAPDPARIVYYRALWDAT
ncbi:phosphotransferase [Agromyces sp. NPDC058110]|uniref:phosphotransferase n=1 Tax=Agromyces sp. NPDC058110 TaxID=3346345 RepID=UPI0036D861A9